MELADPAGEGDWLAELILVSMARLTFSPQHPCFATSRFAVAKLSLHSNFNVTLLPRRRKYPSV